MNKAPLGIMQGRLSPRHKGRYQAFPVGSWRDEFPRAKMLGFNFIEFIFDFEDWEKSPLFTEGGVREIQEVVDGSGIRVLSVCADYFMRFHLFEENEKKRQNNVNILKKLMLNSSKLGVTDITVPCVDESSLKNEQNIHSLKVSLQECFPEMERYGININLETDLSPSAFRRLAEDLGHKRIKINYDMGNSASLGYNPEEEFAAYGSYISVVHVKDRVFGGGSVRLGTGDVDFGLVFRLLQQLEFNGVITMQAARADNDSEEIDMVREQLDFLKRITGA